MRPLTAAIVLVAVFAALPTESSGQTSSLDGSYVLVVEGSDDVNRAIEASIARMSFIVRPIARARLRKTNIPYRRLRIATDDREVSVTADASAPITSPANGAGIKWRREDGEVLDLSTEWEGRSLLQTFGAKDGSRQNRFSLSPDGKTLTMHVTISSPRLAAPLKYALRYRRED